MNILRCVSLARFDGFFSRSDCIGHEPCPPLRICSSGADRINHERMRGDALLPGGSDRKLLYIIRDF